MGLFALSDLHLSLHKYKPMDKFGDIWHDHHLKVKENWGQMLNDQDTLLICGDTSWAMSLDEAMADLDFLHGLPGKKIFIKGNHDYWWDSVSKLNSLYSDMVFLQNKCVPYNEYAICGVRGWVCHDEKIYIREQARLKLSLDDAIEQNIDKIILMMHYPPTNYRYDPSPFIDIIKMYPVKKVIYGHLHGNNHLSGVLGVFDNVEYILSSADFLKFCPVRVL